MSTETVDMQRPTINDPVEVLIKKATAKTTKKGDNKMIEFELEITTPTIISKGVEVKVAGIETRTWLVYTTPIGRNTRLKLHKALGLSPDFDEATPNTELYLGRKFKTLVKTDVKPEIDSNGQPIVDDENQPIVNKNYEVKMDKLVGKASAA